MFNGKKIKDLSPEEKKEYYRLYYAKNKDRYNKNSPVYCKRYYDKNRERFIEKATNLHKSKTLFNRYPKVDIFY